MHETGTITQGDMEEGTLSTGENGEIDLRSEEVQEIMGRMPTLVERWGILSIAIMLAALLCGAAYFPYPDTLGGGFVYVPGKAEDGVPSSCFALMPVHGIGKVKEGMPVSVSAAAVTIGPEVVDGRAGDDSLDAVGTGGGVEQGARRAHGA